MSRVDDEDSFNPVKVRKLLPGQVAAEASINPDSSCNLLRAVKLSYKES